MKFKKMKGIVLGIVLFTMSSLNVTAAPMVHCLLYTSHPYQPPDQNQDGKGTASA